MYLESLVTTGLLVSFSVFAADLPQPDSRTIFTMNYRLSVGMHTGGLPRVRNIPAQITNTIAIPTDTLGPGWLNTVSAGVGVGVAKKANEIRAGLTIGVPFRFRPLYFDSSTTNSIMYRYLAEQAYFRPMPGAYVEFARLTNRDFLLWKPLSLAFGLQVQSYGYRIVDGDNSYNHNYYGNSYPLSRTYTFDPYVSFSRASIEDRTSGWWYVFAGPSFQKQNFTALGKEVVDAGKFNFVVGIGIFFSGPVH